jgi:hypothetical protein
MMKLFFENWRSHLSEDKTHTQVLREVDEGELEHIQKALEEMEPTDLAFNHLFGDKMRRIIDFDTVDKTTGLGKLVSLWPDGVGYYNFGGYGEDAFKWVPDFSTGTVSRLSPNDYLRKAGLKKDDVRDPFGAGLYGAPTSPEKEKPKKADIRRETMKIGKFLKKGERLAGKREELANETEKVREELVAASRGGWEARVPAVINALEEKRADIYRKLRDAKIELDRHMSNTGAPLFSENWQELSKFWQQNAAFLKENPDGAKSDTYKIILSRHPIDILRMSDFAKITSCHKPPSHPNYEGPQNNYYQCAVAEAHGEGAMAYVVQKGVLFSETGAKTIEEAEEAINASEEIFYDNRRPEAWGGEGDNAIGIIPNSRVRLRKMTYFQPDEWLNAFNLKADHGEGTEFALPEAVIYGDRISGLLDKVKGWATENQAEQIKHFPRDEKGKVLLSRFIKSGGTYGDNKPFQLMKHMFPDEDFQGAAIVDDTVEKGLDLELGGYDGEAIQREVNRISELYNNSTARNLAISGEIQEDDYEPGQYWITAQAFMIIRWLESEFKSLDHRLGEWVLRDLEDWGAEWIDENGRATFARSGDELVMHIPMDTEHIMNNEGIYDPDAYVEFGERAKRLANQHDDFIKDQANRFAKREGMMHGGVFTNWGWDIINDDADYYDWEATAQEGDNVDIESIEIETQVSINDEDWAVLQAPALTGEYVAKIMNTSEFSILLMRSLFKPIFDANPDRQKYFSNRTVKARVLGDRAATVRITFDVYDESNDDQVENLKEVIEYWDDEDKQMNLVLGIIGRLIGSSGMPKKKEEPKEEGGLGSLKEHFKRFL